jgi:hypothetical protein
MSLRTVTRDRRRVVIALACSLMAACGGGDSGSGGLNPQTSGSSLNLSFEPSAPLITDNTATDGLVWFNYRRQQIGLPAMVRNAQLDQAAQAHSDYQRANNVISHEETQGAPGFTGTDLGQRIAATGYDFSSNRYAYGEVISATASTSGFAAAEDLITAIYHRFVIFEPTFFEAGGGSATVQRGYTYFTANFTANGLERGLGRGRFVTYPRAAQQGVPLNFFSDREMPDPVPERNEVGFPISLHADITSSVVVSSFTVRPQGGSPVTTKLLTSVTDTETPASAAAIVPLEPLATGTAHEVRFSGSVDGVAVDYNWTFTTR